MKKIILLVTMSNIIAIYAYSQSIDNMNISATTNYILGLQKDFMIFAENENFEWVSSSTSPYLTFDFENIRNNGEVSIYSNYKSLICKFSCFDIKTSKISLFKSKYYSFVISCKTEDCIIGGKGNLKPSIIIYTSNEIVTTKLLNALNHLTYLLETDNNIRPKSDPFFDKNLASISISNVSFEDENNNARIDESETSSLIISLKNHNQQSINNISVEIKEVNRIKGLLLQENHTIQTLTNNQTKNVEIRIKSNNELQIGEANFKIRIFNNNLEITSKSIKIATFNSGSQDILISKLPNVYTNIPHTSNIRRNIYAIVIGNEDYKSKQPNLSYEANVIYAINDAKIFKEYLINTFGVPNTNITYLTNATSAQINQAINKVKQLPLINSDAEIIFYYAGHGLPDEKTKEQYLIPVDVSSANISFGLKINEIESELASNNPKQVLLILDACFSGAARSESLLSNRGVRVRPKENLIKGNSIILSASSNEEASKAYDEMQHGMFTYFLLTKIQETKGNVDFQSLFDYIHYNVREKSLLINNQIQTPTIIKSSQINKSLNEIKF